MLLLLVHVFRLAAAIQAIPFPCRSSIRPGGPSMLDDIQRLRNSPLLLQLLSHYAGLGKDAWHNRLRHLEDTAHSELVWLHGELIAFSWADQNTGQVRSLLLSSHFIRLTGVNAASRTGALHRPGSTISQSSRVNRLKLPNGFMKTWVAPIFRRS